MTRLFVAIVAFWTSLASTSAFAGVINRAAIANRAAIESGKDIYRNGGQSGSGSESDGTVLGGLLLFVLGVLLLIWIITAIAAPKQEGGVKEE